MNKSINTFFSAFSAGLLLGVLFSPLRGKRIREILFDKEEDDEWPDRETFNVNELIGHHSISFEELKEKIARNNG